MYSPFRLRTLLSHYSHLLQDPALKRQLDLARRLLLKISRRGEKVPHIVRHDAPVEAGQEGGAAVHLGHQLEVPGLGALALGQELSSLCYPNCEGCATAEDREGPRGVPRGARGGGDRGVSLEGLCGGIVEEVDLLRE
jgi:hypothetical protein